MLFNFWLCLFEIIFTFFSVWLLSQFQVQTLKKLMGMYFGSKKFQITTLQGFENLLYA